MQVIKPFPKQKEQTNAHPIIEPIVICDDDGCPTRLENVRSARGILCSGEIIKKNNEYQNIFLIKDDVDSFVHVIHKRQLDIDLGSPTTKRNQKGEIREDGGFIQPMEALGDRDPIKQERRTNPLI